MKAAQSIKTGFLQASTNTASFTAAEVENVGHVFGRLGQGARTLPTYGGQTAFAWNDETATAQSAHGMMFSILPTVPGDTTGLAAGKPIDFVVQAVPFATLADSGMPTQPTAAD